MFLGKKLNPFSLYYWYIGLPKVLIEQRIGNLEETDSVPSSNHIFCSCEN